MKIPAEVSEVRTSALIIIILTLLIVPVSAQEEPVISEPGDNIPEVVGTWDLPGSGAGRLYVNPSDSSVWTFLHRSGTLAALDGSTGDVVLVADLTLAPTAMDFSSDGSLIFVVGEPLDDQTIDVGIFQVLDPLTGTVIFEMELGGACNAVHCAGNGVVYVSCGMQYAYQGTVYKLTWDAEISEFIIEAFADCGKIPWAIVTNDNVLYVTDYELQWTAQADGTMGPPYGAWVWEYDAGTLEFLERDWVGINPNRLEVVTGGVLVGCSGSKQSEGDASEPTLNLLTGESEAEYFSIGTSGASDLAVSPDGNFAYITLADWSEPVASSSVGIYTRLVNPDGFPEAKRWVYTGDIAVGNFSGDEPNFERYNILDDTYLRAVAVSPDGKTVYVLQDEPEKVIAIRVIE